MKKWLFPAGVERDYLRAIRASVTTPLDDACRRVLIPALSDVFAQASRQDADIRELPQSTGWFETLRQAFVVTLAQAGIDPATITAIVRRVAQSVEAFNEREFRAVLRSVYRVDIFTGAPAGVQAAIAQFEAQNVALIKSIAPESLGRMHSKIVEAVREGRTLRDATAMVRDEFGVSDRRAKLIARDQIGKLNGDITRLRQENIGVDSYTWRGLLDARERPEHVAREGKVFAWNKPPEDGHPGQPIRCRCTAEPILPSWEELERQITGVRPPAGTY